MILILSIDDISLTYVFAGQIAQLHDTKLVLVDYNSFVNCDTKSAAERLKVVGMLVC
jgi:hypothetical protein